MTRTTTLSVEDLREVVSPANLNLPPRPRVEAIEIDEKVDSTGDDALEAFVVLDGSEDEDWSGFTFDDVRAVFGKVTDAVQEAGDERFVYTSIGTRRDFELRYVPVELDDEQG